jgi:hypothetical protein
VKAAVLGNRVFETQHRRAQAIGMQRAAHAQLDETRRHDIWPNWGTLNTGLTLTGTWIGSLTGACLLSVNPMDQRYKSGLLL